MAGTKHLIADFELRGTATGKGGWGAEHDAGEFGTGDPGEGGLVLVFAADLEEVEEVGCGGVDGDEVFGRRGCGVGDGGYFEVLWALWYI